MKSGRVQSPLVCTSDQERDVTIIDISAANTQPNEMSIEQLDAVSGGRITNTRLNATTIPGPPPQVSQVVPTSPSVTVGSPVVAM